MTITSTWLLNDGLPLSVTTTLKLYLAFDSLSNVALVLIRPYWSIANIISSPGCVTTLYIRWPFGVVSKSSSSVTTEYITVSFGVVSKTSTVYLPLFRFVKYGRSFWSSICIVTWQQASDPLSFLAQIIISYLDRSSWFPCLNWIILPVLGTKVNIVEISVTFDSIEYLIVLLS